MCEADSCHVNIQCVKFEFGKMFSQIDLGLNIQIPMERLYIFVRGQEYKERLTKCDLSIGKLEPFAVCGCIFKFTSVHFNCRLLQLFNLTVVYYYLVNAVKLS